MKEILLFTFIFIFSLPVFSQEKEITVRYIEDVEIQIDGEINEPVWQEIVPVSDFWEFFPQDSIPAKNKTEMKMIYDAKFIYIAVTVHTGTNDYRTMTLKRDYSTQTNDIDHLNFIFDTFSDATNAFLFGITPYGVRREGLISYSDKVDLNWDQIWHGEVKLFDGYYTTEIRIPFSSIRYKKDVRSWRFNLNRFDATKNTRDTWVTTPANQLIYNLAYMGEMVFEKPLEKRRTPFTLIPYAMYEFQGDYFEGTKLHKPKIGGDVKIPIGNSMNLDLTINPDFSTTDVDEGRTNITRFELRLPERRQFFLDNADLFGRFGEDNINPFFSRRIGVAKDTFGNDFYIPIQFGARFSGKVTEDLRVGLLDAQVSDNEQYDVPSTNDLVFVAQQRIFKRSNVGILFANRMVVNASESVEDSELYSRVLAAEFNLFSEGNKWTGKYYFQKAFSPGIEDEDMATGGFLQYNIRKHKFRLNASMVGKEYNPALGFVLRRDDIRINPDLTFYFYPKDEISKVFRYELIAKGTGRWRASTGQSSDYDIGLQGLISFKVGANLRMEGYHRYTYLFNPFDPTRTPGADPLPVGGYKYNDISFRYTTTGRNALYFQANVTGGGYFSGNKLSAQATVRYRLQPYLFALLKVNYDYIVLPDQQTTSSVIYVNPSFEVTFNKKLFWNTDIQFNSQNKNLGINSRLQWRYTRLSDLYIIYVDNYQTSSYETSSYETNGFALKTRGIYVKVSYWLNL